MSIFHLTVKRGSRSDNRLSADKHDYIMRAGRFAKRHDGDLAHREDGNLPAWATADPRSFWVAADAAERANATLYHEVEFALPRELTDAQQIEAAQELVHSICRDQHPYTWGIHAKRGNPHVHLMFSGRMLDGIERDSGQYFKRYNAKAPEKGGCRKEASGDARGPDWVSKVRQDWQEIANRHLAAAGHDARIDHRSHKARGLEEAPGVHLGRRSTRLEQKGKTTWRGNKNREAAHLNASLQEVKSRIHQKEYPNGEQRHGRPGKPQSQQQRASAGGSAAARQRAGFHVVADQDRRQAYKARLLQQHYQQHIQAALAARLAYVEHQPDRIAITLKGGGRVVDHGDHLQTRDGRDPEIKAAIALAKAKGWTTLSIAGTDDFKARAWLEAARAGLAVAGYEPAAEVRAQLTKEMPMLDTPAGGAALTPDATPEHRNAAAARRWEVALRTAHERLDAERKTTRAAALRDIDQHRKAVTRWLETVQRGQIDDDFLWQVAHHEAEFKRAPEALAPIFRLRAEEAEARKQAREEARKAQNEREIAAQQQADAIADQLAQPGLTAEQTEVLEARQRYYQALADGCDEAEARERTANPSRAPRPR